MKRLNQKSIRKKKFYMESWIKKGLNIKGDTKRGDIHIQVATLNVNMTFEGEAGGVLTLTLELRQNDIFLILMWNNFNICRITYATNIEK